MVKGEMKVAVVGGGALLTLAALAYFGIKQQVVTIRPSEGIQYSLIIEATVGGTTDPEPGRYVGKEPATVTVTAIVFNDYEFDGWYLDGELVSTELVYTVNVTENVLLIASFREIDGPVLIPAYIKPIQSCVAEDWWKVWVETKQVGVITHQYLHLGHDFFVQDFIKYKICDAAGNGVPDQQIALYTDPLPDITDYGWVYVKEALTSIDYPVILTSNSVGVVAAKIRYRWQELNSDYKWTIGQGGRARWQCYLPPNAGWLYPMFDGAELIACDYTKYERVRHPIYRTMNPVHAYWVDNPSLPVTGDAYADCMIKLEESKNL